MDISLSIVPVEDVVFDTFRDGFVRLSEADAGTIGALRGRIKPIYEPKYDPAKKGDWMRDTDLAIGYVGPESGNAFSYTVKMLNLHEIVNDVIDRRPVLISYSSQLLGFFSGVATGYQATYAEVDAND